MISVILGVFLTWENLMIRFLPISVATAALLAAAPAQAVVINAGSSGLLFDPFVAATQGTLLANATLPGVALTFTADVREAVYRNTSGTLDFYYQFARTGGGALSSQMIGAFTAAAFGGYTVEGFVSAADPDGAGIFTAANNPPASTTTTGRNATGIVLQTDFGTNGLMGLETSATYIFRTNAVNYDALGTVGVINGSTFTVQGFQPIAAAVPEPSTWAMMLIGFAGLAYASRRKAKAIVAV
jgi:PEP-CTERM motif